MSIQIRGIMMLSSKVVLPAFQKFWAISVLSLMILFSMFIQMSNKFACYSLIKMS